MKSLMPAKRIYHSVMGHVVALVRYGLTIHDSVWICLLEAPRLVPMQQFLPFALPLAFFGLCWALMHKAAVISVQCLNL